MRLLIDRVAGATAEWAVMVAPLAIYFLFLARFVYRRRRPTAISGVWNMLGVFLAASGFLLLGAPSWLAAPFRAWGDIAYAAAYGAYLCLLFLVVLIVVRRQRKSLVLLNINPNDFACVMQEVLAEAHVDYTATPGRIALAGGQLVIDLESSYVWNSVVLDWHGDDQELRARIESSLRKALGGVESGKGPAALLLVMMAAALVLFACFGLALYSLATGIL
jgi:hypothetical protein